MKKKNLIRQSVTPLIAITLALAITLSGTWAAVQALGPIRIAVAGDPVVPPDMVPLNQDPPAEPPNLFQFVKNKPAAIKLGKALFWDMQVGSDGIQACASCHFSAGADNRVKNTVHPGPDNVFQVVAGPNTTIDPTAFPFHQRAAPADSQGSAIVRDSNDRVGSQGVKLSDFVDIVPGSAVDNATPVPDTLFNVGGENMRRVTGRNTPTVINAAFNLNNFWDGRASFIFNGENPFGPADANAGVWFNEFGTGLAKRPVTIEFAGLASQATGPALDGTEMSARGRTFPKLGRKMLSLVPLGKQTVHPGDSVIGPLSKARILPNGRVSSEKGLATTYSAMIQTAFQDNLWNSPLLTPEGYTQMEANFSLFWGLSIQLYEATLISDQTPFDKWLGGDTTALTAQEKSGFNLFMGIANCGVCHVPPVFAEVPGFTNNNSHVLMELMWTSDGTQVIYDAGFQNTAVTRISDDIGRGGNTPFVNPSTGQPYPLSFSTLSELQRQGLVPFPAPILPFHIPTDMPVNVNGAFKMPGLRNVELTAPYFHNGSVMTLEEVVNFYIRGGNFPEENLGDLDPLVGAGLPLLRGKDAMKASIVAFMKALTDPRVRSESAPFDHPELLVPNGDPEMIRIPARDALGNSALTTLTINPVVSPTTSNSQTVSGTVEAGLTPEATIDTTATVGAVTVVGTDWNVPVTGMPQGINTISVSVVDAVGTRTTLTASIRVVPAAPVITSTAVTSATTGLPYSYDVNATDANNGDTLTYGLAVSPAGMTINAATGLIAWTPSSAQLGPNNVSVRVTDTGGLFASQTFTITVSPPVPTFAVSGRVTNSAGGVGMPGVRMTLGGAGSGSVLTDALGNYSFAALPNGRYTITPSIAGFRFSPVSRTIDVLNRPVAGMNYSGILIPVPPAAPSGLAAAAISSVQVNLTWADNSNNETGFRLERKIGAAGAWAAIANLGTNVTSFSNRGLLAGTTYSYRIRALNAAGFSAYSNEVSVTMP